MTIKQLRQALAELNTEERSLRTEAAAVYAAARETQDGKLSEEQTKRDDDIKLRLMEIDERREELDSELENAERLQQLDRTAPAATPATTSVRESVQDDPKRGFATIGHFAQAVMEAGPSPWNNQRLLAAAGTGMVQGIREDGGVLVPPAFSREVWDGAQGMSDSLLQYCDVVTVDAGVDSITTPAINETSRADGSRWGGIRGYWKGELTQMSESRPKFRDVKIEPQELYVLAYISDKLLKRAPGAASQILLRAAADEINFKLGDAIMNGDGVGKPLGVIGHASVVGISKQTGQAAATIVKQNIDKMWARCHASYRRNAVWFINQDCEPQLEELAAEVGTGGMPVYLPPGGISETPNARLKGRPVVPIEYCATLGTSGDIVLANLSAYRVGIRGGVDQAESMHLKFDYAQTAFRFIFEADGQPMLHSAITPFKGSNTLSPFVTLNTRS